MIFDKQFAVVIQIVHFRAYEKPPIFALFVKISVYNWELGLVKAVIVIKMLFLQNQNVVWYKEC